MMDEARRWAASVLLELRQIRELLAELRDRDRDPVA
jgi:hypothetical protein